MNKASNKKDYIKIVLKKLHSGVVMQLLCRTRTKTDAHMTKLKNRQMKRNCWVRRSRGKPRHHRASNSSSGQRFTVAYGLRNGERGMASRTTMGALYVPRRLKLAVTCSWAASSPWSCGSSCLLRLASRHWCLSPLIIWGNGGCGRVAGLTVKLAPLRLLDAPHRVVAMEGEEQQDLSEGVQGSPGDLPGGRERGG